MGWFTETQLALASGKSVFYGELYKAEFESETGFYWDGFGDISAYSSTWLGRAGLVARSEIPFGVDDDAVGMTLTMSGVDEDIVARVRAAEAEVVGKPLTIWGQFFGEDLQVLDTRFFLFAGTFDVPTYGGTGVAQRAITFPVEGEWADRNGAEFDVFSHLSQQRRFPGDRGLEYVYRYHQGVRRTWPAF